MLEATQVDSSLGGTVGNQVLNFWLVSQVANSLNYLASEQNIHLDAFQKIVHILKDHAYNFALLVSIKMLDI